MRRSNSNARRLAASLALAIFIAGSNYCLVGTIASAAGLGARMSCMAPAAPAAGACHAGPSSHCASARKGTESGAPVRTGTPPCCVALAPVVAAAIQKAVTLALVVAPLPQPVAVAADPAPPARTCAVLAHDAGPPFLIARAPLPLRAPPLA